MEALPGQMVSVEALPPAGLTPLLDLADRAWGQGTTGQSVHTYPGRGPGTPNGNTDE